MLAAEAELKCLMLAGLAGDKAAYRALLMALGDVLRRYYRRRIGPEDAEDLVQEALIGIHSRRATYDTRQPFTPWLYAIARYKLLDHLRRARVRATVPLEDAGALFAEDESEAALARRDLDALLQGLPEPTRALIRSVKIEGLSMQEAAERAGRSEIAVRVGIHRGLKALSDRLRGKESREDG
ncbi:MAG TPA: sigma-70 family RNA polymerase sigma factor [Rhizomicrobium sp.]|nr:sigma-70 family RNA polymerase sigma factor [Rhizomicrobium sp.]